MIVKNEEKVIDRCLKSVTPLVDEIIIVDTGSQDNTKKISTRYHNIPAPLLLEYTNQFQGFTIDYNR